METFGALFDRLSIGKIREYKILRLAAKTGFPMGLAEKSKNVYIANVEIEKELSDLISNSIKNGPQRPLGQNKEYLGELETKGLPEDVGVAISNLFIENLTIWELEDRRRNKSLPDSERLKAADSVSTHNRARNDLIDKINKIFYDLCSKTTSEVV